MQAVVHYLKSSYTWQKLAILFVAALVLRGAVFYGFTQHNERYQQPDSMDYHNCAVCLSYGFGMMRPDTKEPLFWRTPGYPLFLKPFYSHFQAPDSLFPTNRSAQMAALWMQIFLCSLLPLLTFFLALRLCNSLPIAWLTAWLSVIHVGFILNSGYLLTDALAQLFFVSFLLFLYKSFATGYDHAPKFSTSLGHIIISVLCLSAYTWMRPHAQFLPIIVALVLLLGYGTWRHKIMRIALFLVLFYATLAPWYIRNHNLTGEWFFCPMFGPYLNSFCVTKIVSRVHNVPLDKALQFALYNGYMAAQEDLALAPKGKFIAREFSALRFALPWIQAHPWLFLYDWFLDVCKTAFDPYSTQFAQFANNTFKWDPIQERLTDRVAAALWRQPMPFLWRLICWTEFLFVLLQWLTIFAGIFLFLVYPLFKRFKINKYHAAYSLLWLKTGLFVGAFIAMTGGFGYARLRMPVEPLMFILAFTVIFWLLRIPLFQQSSTVYNENKP